MCFAAVSSSLKLILKGLEDNTFTVLQCSSIPAVLYKLIEPVINVQL